MLIVPLPLMKAFDEVKLHALVKSIETQWDMIKRSPITALDGASIPSVAEQVMLGSEIV